jgi:hypothetical protein
MVESPGAVTSDTVALLAWRDDMGCIG